MGETSKPKVIVIGADWYGGWATGLYAAFRRLGYDAKIVFNNSFPTAIGGGSGGVTNFIERFKLRLRRLGPRTFSFFKNVRRWFSEREVAWAIKRSAASGRPTVAVFVWTPPTAKTLEDLRGLQNVQLVLWLGEPVVRDASWEPTFTYFDQVFMVDEGPWLEAVQPENRDRVRLLPLSGDESIFRPLGTVETEKRYCSEVSFIGKYLPSRASTLSMFKDRDLKIYGHGWADGYDEFPWLRERYMGPLSVPEANLVYNNSQVVIGTLGTPEDPFTTTTQRTFEIALAGGFQVGEEVRLTKKIFGDTVKTFRNTKELKELVEYYLGHPEERKKMAAGAHRVAKSSHGYDSRARQILAACGFNQQNV